MYSPPWRWVNPLSGGRNGGRSTGTGYCYSEDHSVRQARAREHRCDDLISLVRGGLLVIPNADAGVVASGHAPFHTLQLLTWISQVCIVDRRSGTLLFAQCVVDPE